MSKRTKASSGNPAKTQQDPDEVKLYKAMRSTVELVRDLKGRLTPEQILWLEGSSVGLMFAYAELTGLPNPIEVIRGDIPMTPEFEEKFTG